MLCCFGDPLFTIASTMDEEQSAMLTMSHARATRFNSLIGRLLSHLMLPSSLVRKKMQLQIRCRPLLKCIALYKYKSCTDMAIVPGYATKEREEYWV
jgi:hypothetical protein